MAERGNREREVRVAERGNRERQGTRGRAGQSRKRGARGRRGQSRKRRAGGRRGQSRKTRCGRQSGAIAKREGGDVGLRCGVFGVELESVAIVIIQGGKEKFSSLGLVDTVGGHTEFHRDAVFKVAGVEVLHG